MDSGHAEAWLIKFTKQLRSKLPSAGGYIITHARPSIRFRTLLVKC